MPTRKRTIFVLRPFKPDFEPVQQTIESVATEFNLHCTTSAKGPGLNILKNIISGIDTADIVVADLTPTSPDGKPTPEGTPNPNVMYELGLANALSKDCLMISQPFEKLPFDQTGIHVQRYTNDPVGRQELGAFLRKKIKLITEKGTTLECPYNVALDAKIRRARVVFYFLYGVIGGALLGLVPSLITFLIGMCLRCKYDDPNPTLQLFGKFFGGASAGFVTGGAVLLAYALLFNHYQSRAKNQNLEDSTLKRLPLIFAETGAGVFGGFVMGLIVFLTQWQRSGLDIGASIAIAYLFFFVFTGLAIGLCLNIQPPLAEPERLANYILKSTVVCVLVATAFVVIIEAWKSSLFFEEYLKRYQLGDVVGDAARLALWTISISILHWWLKFVKRF